MDKVKRLFDRTRDGFVNIAPINGDVLGEIDEIISAGNVTIHIFDMAFMCIENLLGSIFDRCQDHDCRVTIHIPKYMNDFPSGSTSYMQIAMILSILTSFQSQGNSSGMMVVY